jgi:hypothetical protein
MTRPLPLASHVTVSPRFTRSVALLRNTGPPIF